MDEINADHTCVKLVSAAITGVPLSVLGTVQLRGYRCSLNISTSSCIGKAFVSAVTVPCFVRLGGLGAPS